MAEITQSISAVRLVDLGAQVSEGCRKFALWNAADGHFVELNAEQAWSSWAGFEASLRGYPVMDCVKKSLRALVVEWETGERTARDAEPCPMCCVRAQTWEGFPPRCAFPWGEFVGENWNCATMNALRRLAGDEGLEVRINDSSLGVAFFENKFIVMSWYKNRGKTDHAVLIADGLPPRPLTLAEAEECIKWNKEHPQ